MRPYYGKIYFYTFVDYYASYGYISLIIVGKMLGFEHINTGRAMNISQHIKTDKFIYSI